MAEQEEGIKVIGGLITNDQVIKPVEKGLQRGAWLKVVAPSLFFSRDLCK